MKKNKLSVLREKSGLTKTDVAIFLNMTTSGITGIERSTKISLDKAMKLSKIYGVSIYDIFNASREFMEA
ncbi:TPA: helix-turn-helix transcriptional regulator [Clostridioides difficile]|uniref:helix-turn-helix transcriptional regulator n=1 Tax=Clostridioides difficile TaxID=1496 RepID=UPI0009779E8B|nr:helix-turn-helix transcriptional regulator [Clostridioides difficile]MBS1300497.1 XRE family transcriptional regulator [Clostridioides difficile]MBY1695087.1 helix-turn-helix domain-containing protein [Clostridioides difficile]MBY2557813.1 helix-turn-helix domain-containing protein [Clostridioides difficile]MCD8633474.1 helix-turn-helix domain-containing protein [Clostridioides difficile]MCI4874959.1 helix-turn-helix domain-containing protein [Clostridioides difficile]